MTSSTGPSDNQEFIRRLLSPERAETLVGITTLLEGTVNALRPDTATRPGFVHAAWVFFLLYNHVWIWLARWRASSRPEWTVLAVLSFLFVPIVLFALAKLVFPPEGREVHLTTYFREIHRPFFSLLALMTVAMAIGPLFFFEGGVALEGISSLWTLLGLPVFGLLAWSPNRRLHLAAAILFLLSTLAGLASDAYAIGG